VAFDSVEHRVLLLFAQRRERVGQRWSHRALGESVLGAA
jgi:hypothetical protein